MHIANLDMNPAYVGAVRCCKAPLWARRLDLGSLDLAPRFAHRPLLLPRLAVVKKRPQGVPQGWGLRTARCRALGAAGAGA